MVKIQAQDQVDYREQEVMTKLSGWDRDKCQGQVVKTKLQDQDHDDPLSQVVGVLCLVGEGAAFLTLGVLAFLTMQTMSLVRMVPSIHSPTKQVGRSWMVVGAM